MLQAVHETFECVAVSEHWGEQEVPMCQVVVIGLALEEQKMRETFRNCMLPN